MFRRTVMARMLLVGLAATLFSPPLHAETQEMAVCRAYASAAADDWAEGSIARANDTDEAPEGSYVAIIYGKRYIVPRDRVDNGDLHVKSLGQRTLERKKVYYEELTRCLKDS